MIYSTCQRTTGPSGEERCEESFTIFLALEMYTVLAMSCTEGRRQLVMVYTVLHALIYGEKVLIIIYCKSFLPFLSLTWTKENRLKKTCDFFKRLGLGLVGNDCWGNRENRSVLFIVFFVSSSCSLCTMKDFTQRTHKAVLDLESFQEHSSVFLYLETLHYTIKGFSMLKVTILDEKAFLLFLIIFPVTVALKSSSSDMFISSDITFSSYLHFSATHATQNFFSLSLWTTWHDIESHTNVKYKKCFWH